MISLKEINTAIVDQVTYGLSDTAYSSVSFASTNIKEKIERPSFYVEFSDNKTGLFNANNTEHITNVKIYYFPKSKDKYKIELMEVQEYLSNIFLKYVKINDDFYINIEEIEFDITDGWLICSMELYILEELEEDLTDGNQELMENIELEI